MTELYEKSLRKLELDRVLELLRDCAVSGEAKDRCMALVPNSDREDVIGLQLQTSDACHLINLRSSPAFQDVKDVRASLDRADRGGSLTPKELLAIAGVLRAARSAKDYYDGAAANTSLDWMFASLTPNRYLEERITGAILSEEEIADAASSELSDIRRHMRIQSAKIKESLQKLITSPSYAKFLRDPIITLRQDRYVVPVKAEFKNEIPGLIHDVSSTGSTFFIEPMSSVNANNALRELLLREKKEIERILAELSAEAAAHRETISQNYTMLVELDVIFARAKLSFRMNATAPEIRDDGALRLDQARHPLIDAKAVVPISVALGVDYDTLIITGPNTGGKTVTLKTVGLLTLMAECGLHIPARSGSFISTFDQVLADIGDEQSIEQSLSTFSGHMTNLVSILRDVRPGDLFLVDEICSGTDPNEGAALAMAILDYLTGRGVWSIVTTHYSELKTFAFGRKGMENASVEFNPDTLLPTYRLLMGVPGSSNAFSISRRLGLPDAIIDKAGAFLNEEHAHMEDVIQGLETQRRQYEESSRELEQLRFESETLRNELVFKKREFEKQRNELLRKARYQADEIYRNSRREAEAVLKELRHLRADADPQQLQETAMEARKRLNKQLSLEEPLPKGKPLTPKTAKEGMTVFVTNLRKDGIIREVKGREALVSVGVLKITLPLQECLLVKDAPKPQPERSKYRAGTAHELFVAKAESAAQEVDVRGMTTDEAVPYVDRAIDDALLAGMTQVRIIHGKGTGALRAGLHAYLKTHRSVAAFAMANESLGGAGVTIVTVK